MPNLSYRKPRIPDLGKVFGLVYRANEQAIQLHQDIGEDLAAFHAPSECYPLAYAGCERVVQDAVKTAEAVTGMKWHEIYDEVYQRTGGRWFNWLVFNSMIPLGKEG